MGQSIAEPLRPRQARSVKASHRERLWRAMRQLRSFDLRQLRMTTETAYHVATRFVRGLWLAGYIAKLDGGVLLLIRDTGPRPPRFRISASPGCELLGLVDQNSGEWFGIGGRLDPGPAKWQQRRTQPEPSPRRKWHARWRRRRSVKRPPKLIAHQLATCPANQTPEESVV
jgi:hypothetical protein